MSILNILNLNLLNGENRAAMKDALERLFAPLGINVTVGVLAADNITTAANVLRNQGYRVMSAAARDAVQRALAR